MDPVLPSQPQERRGIPHRRHFSKSKKAIMLGSPLTNHFPPFPFSPKLPQHPFTFTYMGRGRWSTSFSFSFSFSTYARAVASRIRNSRNNPFPSHSHSSSQPSAGARQRHRTMESDECVPLSVAVSDCVRRWFKDTLKAALAGDTSMQILLAQMYHTGYGVAKNEIQANRWIKEASKYRSSASRDSSKRPGYNGSDSDSDNGDENGKQ